VLALDVAELLALVGRMHRQDAVRGVGTPDVKVLGLEAAVARGEQLERLRLVLLHRGDCLREQRLFVACNSLNMGPECHEG